MVNQENTKALLSWLSKMVFRMKVELADRSAEFALVGTTKPKPQLAYVSNSQPLVWKDGWPGVTPGGYRYSTREVNYSWFEHLVEASQLDHLLSTGSLAGTMAADALRVAAGRPLAASEIDEK